MSDHHADDKERPTGSHVASGTNEYRRLWRLRNPEKAREYRRRWLKKHPGADAAKYKRKLSTASGAARVLWSVTKRRAAKRGIAFDLPADWIAERLAIGVCELSGIQFMRGARRTTPYSPSIDRINNAGGYTADNCRLILWALNRFKGEWDDDVMLAIARALVSRGTQ